MSELTPLNTDINREIDKDPFASDCLHHRPVGRKVVPVDGQIAAHSFPGLPDRVRVAGFREATDPP